MATTFYVVIGLIILVVIGGVIFWKLDTIKDFFKKDEEPKREIIYAELNLFARDRSNNLISVDYQVIDNNSRVLQRGTLKKGVIERFKDTKENRSYVLSAFGKGLYKNTQNCPLNEESCTVILENIADVYLRTVKIKDDYSIGILYLENGIIIDPILCIKWENLVSFSINMSEINIPIDYYNEYDKCYSFEQNLTSGIYQFNINHKITDQQPNIFEMDFIDKCNGKYIREDCASTININQLI